VENNKRSYSPRYKGGSSNYRKGSRPSRGRRSSNKQKISRDAYIAKAVEGYVPPSIYVEDKFYEEFDILEILKKNIRRKGYKNPTKIQFEAIPYILKKKDILGMASTGSGKTAAFLIPMLNKILKDPSQKCLIIVPTRELASQIQDEFDDLARDTGLYSALIIGGSRMSSQINKLKRKPEFIMGTPGRLKDLSDRGLLHLDTFNNIVLDEVDRMLDMGFIGDIKYLIAKLRDQRQTLFFSATMTNEAEKIANSLLKDPVKVQVEKESPLNSVDQDIVKVGRNEDKVEILSDLLQKDEFQKVLIFSRTKYGADKLSQKLYKKGFRVDAIHGDKSQGKRSAVLSKFKGGEIDILIATDVAARGLDIPNVSHVINYDEPENYKDYIHRIGRTARAGKKGCALTFVD
jgi:superfamily II DNA/RNA helicase